MGRRATLLIAALAAVLPLAACASSDRTPVVTLITHSSPGGGSDVFLRSMAPHLSRIMKATMVVENVEGGSGAKAMAQLARARPAGRGRYERRRAFDYPAQ